MTDLKFASRQLLKNPGFTAVAVLTLGIGLGVNTTVFGFFNALAFRPMPSLEQPHQLARVLVPMEHSWQEYQHYRDHNDVFSQLMASVATPLQMSAPTRRTSQTSLEAEDEMVTGLVATPNYFVGLGVKAHLGRTFFPEQFNDAAASPVVVLGHRIWEQRFSSATNVVGSAVRINGVSFIVLGVAPKGFLGVEGRPADVYVPFMSVGLGGPDTDWFNARKQTRLKLFGRLKEGVGRREAAAALDVLSAQLPGVHMAKGLHLVRAGTRIPPEDFTLIVLASAASLAVGLVLLIACVNVATLLSARATHRRREIGIRLALGASRVRLLRQLLTESLVLAALGIGAGLLLLAWTSDLLSRSLPALVVRELFGDIPPDLGLDWRVFGFALMLGLGTTILFGLAPAIEASKATVNSSLKEEPGFFGQPLLTSRVRDHLVIGQMIACLALLTCAGLAVKGVHKSLNVDFGFNPKQVLWLKFNVSQLGWDQDRSARFYENVLERLAAQPQVRSASIGSIDDCIKPSGRPFYLEGQEVRHDKFLKGKFLAVPPEHFQTLALPVLQGRPFTEQEAQSQAAVTVVSEAAGKRFWPGHNPIGQRIQIHDGTRLVAFEVVGVVQDRRCLMLEEEDRAFFYVTMFPPGFGPQSGTAIQKFSWAGMRETGSDAFVRCDGDLKAVAALLPQIVRTVDAKVTVSIQSLEQIFQERTLFARCLRTGSLVLGVVTMILASVGVYTLMSLRVSLRTKEIGVRMALGARRAMVLMWILRQALQIVVASVLVGLPVAAGLSIFLSRAVFGLRPFDLVLFGVVTAILAATALLASIVPAHRATKVDPMEALRHE
ncbi:MAG: ADOP family duplicated permease [Verrucomicrobiales bacterium]|nr:ADOP family duplicated permease [Verrucomicrobiales bacterium]